MTQVKDLKIGDKIMPPERELRLWMRRWAQERNLTEAALVLTITDMREGAPDKKGRWIIVVSDQTEEWNKGGLRNLPFCFKARPHTPWPVVQS